MSAWIIIEGGGDRAEGRARLREGFRKLFSQIGNPAARPTIEAGGGRSATFRDFKIAVAKKEADYVALLVDSEEPAEDIERPWDHLRARDGWAQPRGVGDDQALLMVTCMETWIAADRDGIKRHYGKSGPCVLESQLPAIENIESRDRRMVQEALAKSTAHCPNKYEKGKRSFDVLASLDAAVLERNLESFKRVKRILNSKLK